MLEKIENTLKEIFVVLQTAKLYGFRHPIFLKSVDKAFFSLSDVLKGRSQLVVGVIAEELACENEIFFELSRMARPTIIYLKNRGIERIVFRQGLTKTELTKLFECLAAPKEEMKADPQEYLLLVGVKNISIGKLKAVSEKDREGVGALPTSIYESSFDKISQALTNILDRQSVDQLLLKFSINNIVENLTTQYQDFLKLATLRRYDLGTFVHLLNVSILSIYFSSKLGFDKNDVLDTAVAAIFHDIGKLYVSRKIIKKTEKLTDAEFTQVKSHAVLGAEIMLDYTDGMGILPVVVCYEHHLKYNSSGYPKSAFVYKPHIASMIVSICDIYDALSERRVYKNDYPPDMIYKIMSGERGTGFEPELLDNFFKIMGVWPVGSTVYLNDGRIALVKEENEGDIFSPKVEVIYPLDKKESIDLSQTKGRISIERYLNPWKQDPSFMESIGISVRKKT